jgi:CBS domain containing-hemolysin-like protein
MSELFMLLGLLVLLLLQGFFSGSEIAIVNCDRGRLRHRAKQGDAGSKLALRLLERPEVILSTTLVGTNIALVLLTAITTTSVIAAVGDSGDLYATLMLIPITLILGEVVPKSVFQQRADELTPRIMYPLYGFYLLFFPIVFLFSRIARTAARVFGRNDPGAGIFTMRAKLRSILDMAEGGANINVFDRSRIRNVVRFGEFVAGDVMLPASEMDVIDAEADSDQLLSLVRRTGREQVPVYEGHRSQVTGMVSVSVWELANLRDKPERLSDLIRPALFVPSQQPLVELLHILRNREDQAAVVVDEFGSAIGLITVDRILETVVGQVNVRSTHIENGGDSRPGYQNTEDGAYILDARLPVAEVNELLGTRLYLSEARTIGGLIVARLKHVPSPGEFMTDNGYRFTVEKANERAVIKLRAELLE